MYNENHVIGMIDPNHVNEVALVKILKELSTYGSALIINTCRIL